MRISDKAEAYASRLHAETNHTYDGKPYTVHLKMVVAAAEEFMHPAFTEAQRDLVLAGCWTHDVIEDCRETYNDVKAELNVEVAELAYALTNEKGKNRKERANDKYYAGIRATPLAAFVKMCDRVANVRYSLQKNSRMFDRYRKENIGQGSARITLMPRALRVVGRGPKVKA